MKNMLTVALSSMIISSAAIAAPSSNVEPNDTPFQGVYSQTSTTRAQVHADVIDARAKGLIVDTETGYPTSYVNENNSHKSRQEVKAELKQSKMDGSYYNPLVNGA